jgi:ketosteroid isomerase-like protein
MPRICSYLFLLSFLSCNEGSKTGNTEQERISSESQEVKKIIDNKNIQIIEWYKNKQGDSLVSYMAENVIQFPPNHEPLRGKDSVRKYWEQLFQFGTIEFSLQVQEAKANGPLAVELGMSILKFTPNQDSPIPAFADSGNYLVHWQKINGDWKIVWDAPVSSIPLPQSKK